MAHDKNNNEPRKMIMTSEFQCPYGTSKCRNGLLVRSFSGNQTFPFYKRLKHINTVSQEKTIQQVMKMVTRPLLKKKWNECWNLRMHMSSCKENNYQSTDHFRKVIRLTELAMHGGDSWLYQRPERAVFWICALYKKINYLLLSLITKGTRFKNFLLVIWKLASQFQKPFSRYFQRCKLWHKDSLCVNYFADIH